MEKILTNFFLPMNTLGDGDFFYSHCMQRGSLNIYLAMLRAGAQSLSAPPGCLTEEEKLTVVRQDGLFKGCFECCRNCV